MSFIFFFFFFLRCILFFKKKETIEKKIKQWWSHKPCTLKHEQIGGRPIQCLKEALEMSWEGKDSNGNGKNGNNTIKLLLALTLEAGTNLRQESNLKKVVLWQTNTCSRWCVPELECNISFIQHSHFDSENCYPTVGWKPGNSKQVWLWLLSF